MKSSNGENLIFIISQPRAGSTLLQLMLSGHPDIATTSEPWIALHPVFSLMKEGIDTVYNSKLARLALIDFLKQSGVDESFYKRQVTSFLLSLYNRSIAHQKKKIFLDKTPRYYHIINELIEIFPNAKFIIIFRNPLAVLNSILTSWVKNDILRLSGNRDDLMIAPQKMIDFIKCYPDKSYHVKYEDLVMQPESVFKEICSYLGIPYSNQMLDYGKRRNSEWKFGDAFGVHNASRPTLNSLDKWKKGFTTPQERLIAISYLRALGPELIKKMGYNYSEIESSIDVPSEKVEGNLISWATIMSDIGGFSKTKEVRNVVHRILSDGRPWNQNQGTSDITGEDDELREMVNLVAKKFMDSRTEELKKERDWMLNTLSWRLTMPLRMIGKYLKFYKNT